MIPKLHVAKEPENEEFTYRQIYGYIKNGKYPKYSRNATNSFIKKRPSFKFKVQEMQVGTIISTVEMGIGVPYLCRFGDGIPESV